MKKKNDKSISSPRKTQSADIHFQFMKFRQHVAYNGEKKTWNRPVQELFTPDLFDYAFDGFQLPLGMDLSRWTRRRDLSTFRIFFILPALCSPILVKNVEEKR